MGGPRIKNSPQKVIYAPEKPSPIETIKMSPTELKKRNKQIYSPVGGICSNRSIDRKGGFNMSAQKGARFAGMDSYLGEKA